jgi:hypothetical protein
MIIKEMFYIPIKLKPELSRASMTTSDVNIQSRETGRIEYTRRRQTKQTVTHYALDTTIRIHTNTNNVNAT